MCESRMTTNLEQLFLAKLLIAMATCDPEGLRWGPWASTGSPVGGVSINHLKLMQISRFECTSFFLRRKKNIAFIQFFKASLTPEG